MQVAANYIDEIFALLVFGFSLNLVLGYTGLFTAAQAAFGAIGGYALVWFVSKDGYGYIPAAAIGVGGAGVVGLFIGFAVLRLEALWLLLLTLAFLLVVVGALANIPALGGGFGIEAPKMSVFGHSLNQPTAVMPLLAISALVVFLLCYRMGESPYGRVLRAVREDEVAARSLGKDVYFYKLSVFAITAAMGGFGGVLLSTQTALASPTLFGFAATVQMMSMVIIGGVGNLWGTIVGVVVVVLATPFFQNVINLSASTTSLAQSTAYGVALVVVIAFRPRGLVPEGTSVLAAPRALARLWAKVRSFFHSGVATRRGGAPTPTEAVAADALTTDSVTFGSEIGGDTARPPSRGPARATSVRTRDEVVAGDPKLGVTETNGRWDGAPTVLRVRDLAKAFGGIRAVDGLSMDLRQGLITALVGPNGAGKTTVFNLLTGALPVDSGHVVLRDREITGMRPDEVTKLGMARSFQDVRVFPALSVLDNVMLGVQNQPGERLRDLYLRPRRTGKAEADARERAYEWLRFIEMEALASVRAESLAFGQQKLVALARILATEAEVLLLDEPGSGIDYAWLDELLGVVEELRKAGRTICLVEHNLEVVGRLADHVYFMELGRVTAEGTFAELTSDARLTEAYFGTV